MKAVDQLITETYLKEIMFPRSTETKTLDQKAYKHFGYLTKSTYPKAVQYVEQLQAWYRNVTDFCDYAGMKVAVVDAEPFLAIMNLIKQLAPKSAMPDHGLPTIQSPNLLYFTDYNKSMVMVIQQAEKIINLYTK